MACALTTKTDIAELGKDIFRDKLVSKYPDSILSKGLIIETDSTYLRIVDRNNSGISFSAGLISMRVYWPKNPRTDAGIWNAKMVLEKVLPGKEPFGGKTGMWE